MCALCDIRVRTGGCRLGGTSSFLSERSSDKPGGTFAQDIPGFCYISPQQDIVLLL